MAKLRHLVTDKIRDVGVVEAKKFFGVSAGTISNWANGRTSPSLEAVELVLAASGTDPDSWDVRDDPYVPDETEQAPAGSVEDIKWEGKDVIIAFPLYGGFDPDTHFTLFANYAKYGPERIGLIMEKRTTIWENRNILTHKFLHNTTANWLIMTDHDMIIPCGSPEIFASRYGAPLDRKLYGKVGITRLMSHSADKRIVGSLYFGRHPKGRAQCSSGFVSDIENTKFHDGTYIRQELVKPEEWVAPAFCRIHRSVFEDLKKAIDGGKWPECKPKNDSLWYGFWNPVQVGVGEDVSFGRRCTEIGIKSYVDCGLVCLHKGDTAFGPHNTR